MAEMHNKELARKGGSQAPRAKKDAVDVVVSSLFNHCFCSHSHNHDLSIPLLRVSYL